MRLPRTQPYWTAALVAHLAVVLVLVGGVLLLSRAGGEAALGAGLLGVLLLLAGLPWSLAALLFPAVYENLPGPLLLAAFIAPAALNVCLHAWVYAVVGRRRLARSGA